MIKINKNKIKKMTKKALQRIELIKNKRWQNKFLIFSAAKNLFCLDNKKAILYKYLDNLLLLSYGINTKIFRFLHSKTKNILTN